MSSPSITKNLFKLKKIMKQQKNLDDTVGATDLDIDSILNQINLPQPQPQPQPQLQQGVPNGGVQRPGP